MIRISDSKRRIYPLTGLPPEVIAVTFAKCSRRPEPFDQIAMELNEDKSRKFHEKWVVGYGHGSVAEHAVISMAIENVSILATKAFIEDNRLCSYTEKSTRYQVFDKDRYYKPEKIMDSDLGKMYVETADFLFETYNELIPIMIRFLKEKKPRKEEVPEKLYEFLIKTEALDILRYILPVATLTNLGMTGNARNFEYAIVKFLTSQLDEVKEIGEEIKKSALTITPTLVRYTVYNDYIGNTLNEMQRITDQKLERIQIDEEQKAKLVEYDKEAEVKLVSALLYRFSNLSYEKIKEKVVLMSDQERLEIIDESLKRIEKFDRPLRELEHVYYTFDILMDYGSFRDLQRHRMTVQTNQEFNVDHGYCIPEEIIEAGLKEKYDLAMQKAKECFKRIYEKFPKEAQYIVPMAYRKRTLFTMNLRECFHLIKLRTGKGTHKSYKRISQEMFKEIEKVHPLLAKYIMVTLD